MDMIKKQVNELMDNQIHVLAAIKYLDEKIQEVDKTQHKIDDTCVKILLG